MELGNISGPAVLQLGHGDEAVETYPGVILLTRVLELQLGHGDEAVETDKTILSVACSS